LLTNYQQHHPYCEIQGDDKFGFELATLAWTPRAICAYPIIRHGYFWH
jgi:hypothetical protein